MQNLKEKFQRFMIGRYGADQLGRFLSIVIVILAAVSFFIRSYWFGSLIRSVLIILWQFFIFGFFPGTLPGAVRKIMRISACIFRFQSA